MKQLTAEQRKIYDENLDIIETLIAHSARRFRYSNITIDEIRIAAHEIYFVTCSRYDPKKGIDIESPRKFVTHWAKKGIYRYIVEEKLGSSYNSKWKRDNPMQPLSENNLLPDHSQTESEINRNIREILILIDKVVPKSLLYMRDVLRVMAGIEDSNLTKIAAKYGMSQTNIWNRFKQEFWIIQERMLRYYPEFASATMTLPDLRSIKEFQPIQKGGRKATKQG